MLGIGAFNESSLFFFHYVFLVLLLPKLATHQSARRGVGNAFDLSTYTCTSHILLFAIALPIHGALRFTYCSIVVVKLWYRKMLLSLLIKFLKIKSDCDFTKTGQKTVQGVSV